MGDCNSFGPGHGSDCREGARPERPKPLDLIVTEALAANPAAVVKIRGGIQSLALPAILGHVMRATKGRADGAEVVRMTREKLGLS